MSRLFTQRSVRTSYPRFRRLEITEQGEKADRMSSKHSNQFHRVASVMDSSKQNMLYERYLTKVRFAGKIDEKAIVSKYLNSIRKQYDETSKLSRRELLAMQTKKRQIELMKQKTKIIIDRRQQILQSITTNQQQVASLHTKYEQVKMYTKTLQHMITRMKADSLFYKQFGTTHQAQLHKKSKQTKKLDELLIIEQQNIHKLRGVIQQYEQTLQQNKQQRNKKYKDYCENIEDIHDRDKFILERKERTYELQSIELNDTLDQKNIRMRDVTLVSKVADVLLEMKVNTLLKKYAEVQDAFQVIKIKTGVSDPSLLENKFFSYEETTTKLMKTINAHQKRLQVLVSTEKQLTEGLKEAVNLSLEFNEQFGQGDVQTKQKQLLSQQVINKQLLIDRIKLWVDKNLSAISQQEAKSSQELKSKFQRLCSLSLQSMHQHSQQFLTKKYQASGIRMKKIGVNQHSREMTNKTLDLEEMIQSNNIEEEFIMNSRQSIIKKNFLIKQQKKNFMNRMGKIE